jgi:hypothetical protein
MARFMSGQFSIHYRRTHKTALLERRKSKTLYFSLVIETWQLRSTRREIIPWCKCIMNLICQLLHL